MGQVLHNCATTTIAGKGPYWFIIDTGASGFGVVGPSLARAVGGEIITEVLVSDGSGQNRRTLNEVNCPDVRIGDVTLGDLALIETDARRDIGENGERLGILGMEAFLSLPFFIDYRTGAVAFGDAAI